MNFYVLLDYNKPELAFNSYKNLYEVNLMIKSISELDFIILTK
jgi:hypothetical protein